MTSQTPASLRSSGFAMKSQLLSESSYTSNPLLNLIQQFQQNVESVFSGGYNSYLYDHLKKNVALAQEKAPTMDFGDIECNGIRMLLKHSEMYLQVAVKKKREKDVRNFMEVIKIMDIWFDFVCKRLDLDSPSASRHPEEAISFYRKLFASYNQTAISTILGPQYHLIYSPGLQLPFAIIERAIVFFAAKKTSHMMKGFSLSRKTVAKTVAKIAPTVTATDAATVIRQMNTAPIRMSYALMRFATAMGKTVRVKKVCMTMPTQFRIMIEENEVKIKQCPEALENEGIKFHTLSHGQSPKFKDKLLIYVHGGAFVGPKAGALENLYVKEFANNLPGLTILATDHPPGPESPFPLALQQVLDTYLWVTSGQPEVLEKIGFYPKEIVLLGDSSGGSIVCSLVVVLNEIRNMSLEFKPSMPRSIVLCWPKTSLQYDLFPSLCAAVFDPLLSVQLLCAACVAYIPMLKRDENGNWNLIEDSTTIPMDFIMHDEYKVLESPILSPLHYPKLEELSDVQLHLMAVTNDTLLDESIELARQWKGSVKLTVVDNITHGGFLFNYFSRMGSKCVGITTDLIKDAFFGP